MWWQRVSSLTILVFLYHKTDATCTYFQIILYLAIQQITVRGSMLSTFMGFDFFCLISFDLNSNSHCINTSNTVVE